MNGRFLLPPVLAASLLCACEPSVPLTYATRAEAQAEKIFARGWLPELTPASARAITMRNDLDTNRSRGEFRFDPADFDAFVSRLESLPSDDQWTQWRYQSWHFRISPGRDRCEFKLTGHPSISSPDLKPPEKP